MMSKEELLTPERFIITTKYPGCPFKEGDVLTLFCDRVSPFRTWYLAKEENSETYINEPPAKFPKVFKEVNWWEFRKPEELPDYIRWPNGTVEPIAEYLNHFIKNSAWAHVSGAMPATEKEFIAKSKT